MPRQAGTLVLVATPIGNLGDLSPRAVEVMASADVVACEDTRHTGRLLVHAGVRARRLVSLHGHNEAARLDELLAVLASGETVALVSDAGTPLVSDPGERLVAAAIAAGVEVTAVPGPSAVLAAVVLSGLGTSRWRYEGFLPRKGAERRARLVEIAASPEPVVCYESPRRLAATLSDLTEVCGGERRVAVARELTKLHEEVWRGPLAEAAARAAAGEPRGEHVIVVAGAVSAARPSGEALTGALERLIAAGLARREAVLAAEVLLGVARREAYRAALALGSLEKPAPAPS
ncbi:MAG TPA: 16S rRNA (cytidine(1402)-2'-O)-methyltransferase [Acidimicrobiales bacterium]|nr:16S rRNA (cytidine(1402)-2'-O)-methyltransferase [Acidimicrobiales bacterium]